MKIDWRAKLSSRKFWAALVGFVTQTLLAFGATENTASQVAAIIMAGGTVIAYILSEGMVDAGRNGEKSEEEADKSRLLSSCKPSKMEGQN